MEPIKSNELAQAIKRFRTKSDGRIDCMSSIIKKIKEPQQTRAKELAQTIKKLRKKSDGRIDRIRSIIKKIKEPQQILKGAQGDSFHWKGEATATTPYRKNDVVHFEGSTYVATDTVVGFSLESNVWHLMTSKGADGAKGRAGNDGRDGLNGADGKRGAAGRKGAQGIQGVMGLVWRGQYRLGVSYVVGDVVGLHGSTYVCIGDTEQSPPAGFGWELLASAGEQGSRGMKGEAGSGSGLPIDAFNLIGHILSPTVVQSSLEQVGVLEFLTVTNPIAGSVTGNSATATFAASALTAATATTATSAGTATTAGTVTTAAQPTITSVGTLTGLTSSGQINSTANTQSTSTTTGAIKTAGGMGIAKSVFIGQGITAAGNANFGGDFFISGVFQSTDVNASTSSITGSTIIAGGIGVALDSFFGALIATTSDTIRIGTQKTPASASATGTKGDIVHDTNYIYVCTAANTWKRSLILTW